MTSDVSAAGEDALGEVENFEEEEVKARKPKKPKKKKMSKPKLIGYGVGGFLTLVVLFLWAASLPAYGPVQIGICRTFAELQLVYPETFSLTETEEFGGAHRIYYTFMGPFGEVRSHMMSCKFKQDEQGNLVLGSVSLDRDPVDPELVAKFSRTIPAVIQYGPDTQLPRWTDGSLMSLKRD